MRTPIPVTEICEAVGFHSLGSGASVIVAGNRHFLSALRHGIRVDAPSEFLAAHRGKR